MAKSKSKDKDRGDGPRTKRQEPVKRDGAYVMMLFITLVAITTGCVLLYLDNEEYGGKSPPKEAVTVVPLGTIPKVDPAAPPAPPPPAPGAPDPAPGMPMP